MAQFKGMQLEAAFLLGKGTPSPKQQKRSASLSKPFILG